MNYKKENTNSVVWVTPDCFLDTDMMTIPLVCSHYRVHWIVVLPNQSRYKDSDFNKLKEQYSNLTVEILYERWRIRNPKSLLFWRHLANKINDFNADINYLNIIVNPYCLAMLPTIKSENTIVTAHQGKVHIGMNHKRVIRLTRKIWYGHFHNVNMFSKTQADLFRQDFPNSKIYQFILGLKDFGPATNLRPLTGEIRFLSFGTLNYAKSIETLIDAACVLYERGVKGFKVSINGNCKDWSWYQQRIKYPELFETNIRVIDNKEIPNLFNGCHYLVQPYRVVSQSGPTKIAFNYDLPIIASNLQGFMDEVEDGVNGFTFESGSVENLADRMQQVIAHHAEYPKLIERMRAYTHNHYATETLKLKYQSMLDEIRIKATAMKDIKKEGKPFSLKESLKRSRIVLLARLLHEHIQELMVEVRYLASGNTYGDVRKMRSDLQIRVHAIEKGMSIGNLKEGFGNKKAIDIVRDLKYFLSIGGDMQFTIEACSVLNQYVIFKEKIGQDVADVNKCLKSFMTEYDISPLDQGGILNLKYVDIQRRAYGALTEVMSSRYAVRDFGRKPLDMGLLRKALQMAEKSPSACNRQSWRIHVYSKDKAMKLFNLQGGGKSFASDMQVAILICGDLTEYFINELNLPYVDGGLYGMNLMLALHYHGIASIPLTMGHKVGYVKAIKREMGLPDNEVPILLIGVGSYKDEFRVAVSVRYPYTQYTTFEE